MQGPHAMTVLGMSQQHGGSRPMDMNAILWAAQGGLALIFVPAATVRAVRYDFARQRMAWVAAVPRPLLLFISVAEISGGLGLILPGVLHTHVVLTAIAAAGLGVVQLLALGFHASRHEPKNGAANLLLLAVLALVIIGRTVVQPLA